MNDDDASAFDKRKKLGVKSPSDPSGLPAAPVKRGIRKRGGAPVVYRAPEGSVVVKSDPSATVTRGDRPPRREWTDRPPRAGGAAPYPKREWTERPPRADGAAPYPKREWTERPPRADGAAPYPKREWTERPPRADGAAPYPKREWTERPPRDFRKPNEGGGDTRPPRPPRADGAAPYPKREWTERPPRDFRTPNEGGGDTRPPRPPRADGAAPYPKREWTERPPRSPRADTPGGAPHQKREWTERPPRGRSAPNVARSLTEISTTGVHTFFATSPRGLEQILRDELLALRVQGIEVTPGGATFKGSFRSGLEVNLESRVASRVLWKLAESHYANEDDIFQLAKAIDWPKVFPVDQTIKVQVTAIASPLTSIDFMALKVKDAICDAFRDAVGSRPSVDTSTPNQRIHVFLTRNTVTLYIDVSGEALFKRGYRRDGLTAPIRENLAAGILRLVKWSPDTPLLDPMCGSGTFITEALLIAMNAAPGLRRRNAHERWSLHPVDEFHAMKDAARARIALPENLKLFARDASEEAVRQTRAHVAALGGTAALDHAVCSALALEAPCEHGLVIANPPYGVRLGSVEELSQMYPQFTTVLQTKFSGWRGSFITADLSMPQGLRLSPTQEIKLKNGALDCRLFSFNFSSNPSNGQPRTIGAI